MEPVAQKPFEPTPELREIVEIMAACGVPQEDIGRAVKCNHITLRKYFRDELDRAALLANAKVARNLFQRACDPDGPPALSIFWLKCRAGWRDTQSVEVAGPGGAPIQVDDARAKLAAKIARLATDEKAPDDPEDTEPE
jgi:hypothetical protein